eukprot:4424201-Heterocapsa_arctica.AAC.1
MGRWGRPSVSQQATVFYQPMTGRVRPYDQYEDTRANKCPDYRHDEHRVSTPDNRWAKSVDAAVGAWSMAFEAGVIDETQYPAYDDI